MTTTLSEGVKVPDVGSVNWAGDLEVNWNLLNGALANLSGNVKLDRDNTWTGEQSFTLPIVGSITGTASKAIADEDGTSIKSGYVNVAGNQTVTGQKTWSGENTYTNTYLTLKQTGIEEGELPASNQTRRFRITDKNNASLGWLQHRVNTSGDSAIELLAVNKFSNGQLSTQGSEILNSIVVGLHGDGSRFLTTLGDVYPDLPTRVCNLGTSTNQWSSVYAQSYYYNGTAWGLDKVNTWTGTNAFSNVTTMQERLTLAGDRNAYLTPMWAGSGSGLCLLTGDASKPVYLGNYVAAGNHYTYDSSKGYLRICVGEISTINTVTIEPFGTDTQLGTSTNKWKTLNGVNPGALSLPSATYTGSNAIIEIDRTGWVYDGTANSYSPPVDCWMSISNGGSIAVWGVHTAFGMKATDNIAIPLRLGESYNVSLTHSPDFCRIYPCEGNV